MARWGYSRSRYCYRPFPDLEKRQHEFALRHGHSDRVRQAMLVEAFLAASRNGDFNALLSLVDPDVVLRG